MESNFLPKSAYELIDNVISSYIEDIDDRKDLKQEILYKVFQGLKNKYIEKGRILSWIIAVARNECINFLRVQQRKRDFMTDYGYESRSLFSQGLSSKLIQYNIVDNFKERLNLSDPQNVENRVNKDYFIERWSKREIAKTEHISPKRVRRILKKYFDELNQQFDELCRLTEEKFIDIDY